jgi:hypothetical protein
MGSSFIEFSGQGRKPDLPKSGTRRLPLKPDNQRRYVDYDRRKIFAANIAHCGPRQLLPKRSMRRAGGKRIDPLGGTREEFTGIVR